LYADEQDNWYISGYSNPSAIPQSQNGLWRSAGAFKIVINV